MIASLVIKVRTPQHAPLALTTARHG